MDIILQALLDSSRKDPNVVLVFEPDNAIREKIGKEVVLQEYFTPERLENCQKIIESARSTFFENAEIETNILLHLMRKMPANDKDSVPFFEKVFSCVCNIKGQVEIFGFTLIRKICDHILEHCRSADYETLHTRFMLTKDLVQLLNLAIRKAVTDEGGATGRTILAELKNYSKRGASI